MGAGRPKTDTKERGPILDRYYTHCSNCEITIRKQLDDPPLERCPICTKRFLVGDIRFKLDEDVSIPEREVYKMIRDARQANAKRRSKYVKYLIEERKNENSNQHKPPD